MTAKQYEDYQAGKLTITRKLVNKNNQNLQNILDAMTQNSKVAIEIETSDVPVTQDKHFAKVTATVTMNGLNFTFSSYGSPNNSLTSCDVMPMRL